jgi:hypothetical protein
MSGMHSLPSLMSRISRSFCDRGLGTTPRGNTQWGLSGETETALATRRAFTSDDTKSACWNADGWLGRDNAAGGPDNQDRRKPKWICRSRKLSVGDEILDQNGRPRATRSARPVAGSVACLGHCGAPAAAHGVARGRVSERSVLGPRGWVVSQWGGGVSAGEHRWVGPPV